MLIARDHARKSMELEPQRRGDVFRVIATISRSRPGYNGSEFVSALYGQALAHDHPAVANGVCGRMWDGMPDNAELVDTMHAAIDNPAIAEKIFVRNAEALFFGR
ncbi:hypothetical protein [Rhizobium leguminosarum]|uniref:hypothetical protein n=1 Tax=Rhizobium leguminosarum TaxID=384 RepID=UPI0021BC2DAC|nr:hypothetical protein [Rhizobium leguminosarum]